MAGPRRIVVTGATRGLGRALVEGFSAAGHVVLGCGRSPGAVEELRAGFPAPCDFQVVDVADDGAVRAWAEHLLGLGPAPDLVVSNAGLIHRNAPLWELSDAELSAVFDVNLRGVANVARHLIPPMIEAGRGVLANFSSAWGRSTSPEVAGYCASKWGVEGLTAALAQELPPGVAACAVNPGIIDTEMLRSCFGEASAHYPGPGEWARTAVPFLLGLGAGDGGSQLSIQ